MKRVLLSLCLVLTFFLILFLSSCDAFQAPPPIEDVGEYSRITVNANSSLELITNEKGIVTSVAPLNDEGSVLLAGEDSFVGLSAEKATERIIRLAAELGYLIPGDAESETNIIKLSVSGQSDYAQKLYENTRKSISGVLVSMDIGGEIQRTDALDTEKLRSLVCSVTPLSQEEVKKMSERELYSAISDAREEASYLPTQDLQETYQNAKKNALALSEKEAIADILAGLGSQAAGLHTSYTQALSLYEEALLTLEAHRADLLCSVESSYQQALAALRQEKAELLEQKALLAEMEKGSEEQKKALLILAQKEAACQLALNALTALSEKPDSALLALSSALESAMQALSAVENNFPSSVLTELSAKANEIQRRIQEKSESFYTEFEAAHREEIEAAHAALQSYKTALIAAAQGARS